MPLVIWCNEEGQLEGFDELTRHGQYKVGRWCKPLEEPDRCDKCPLHDIKPAVTFWTEDGYRHGLCAEHAYLKSELEGGETQ